MTTFIDRLKMGLAAFREAYLISSVVDTTAWSDFEARRLRYQILWAQYEQTSYRDAHTWSVAYKTQYAMYRYVRPIYNPAYRLGEFWKTHLFGGLLDSEAGLEGAIPITTDNEALRGAIANLWKYSRWQVRKDVLAVRGTILGDAAIRIVDDVSRERVYLDLLHPGMLAEVTKDPFGNVKGYIIEELREDPRSILNTVNYREVVERSGENVVYSTYLNGELYAWPGNVDRSGAAVAQWAEPYGFVPLVVLQHYDVGLEWGWSELHPIRAKTHEADDVASQISDHIRKTVDPIWLMKGIKKASLSITGAADTADVDRPQPGREELKALWGVPTDGGAQAMVADIDMESALRHLDALLKEIERDVIELGTDIHTASGDASGRALRTARQPVVSKVIQRRATYDAAVVAAQQMAVAIGGWRSYPEYKGFNLDSYKKGDLEHSVAPRPVFEEDPLDALEIDTAFWGAAAAAVSVGVSLKAYLQEAGWDDERIAALNIQEEEYDAESE